MQEAAFKRGLLGRCALGCFAFASTSLRRRSAVSAKAGHRVVAGCPGGPSSTRSPPRSCRRSRGVSSSRSTRPAYRSGRNSRRARPLSAMRPASRTRPWQRGPVRRPARNGDLIVGEGSGHGPGRPPGGLDQRRGDDLVDDVVASLVWNSSKYRRTTALFSSTDMGVPSDPDRTCCPPRRPSGQAFQPW